MRTETGTFDIGDGPISQMPFLTYYPDDYTGEQRVPLIISLHGSGERGTDLAVRETDPPRDPPEHVAQRL